MFCERCEHILFWTRQTGEVTGGLLSKNPRGMNGYDHTTILQHLQCFVMNRYWDGDLWGVTNAT
jgi:hypothetical protein